MKFPLDLDISKNGIITFTPFKWELLGRGQPLTSPRKTKDGDIIILPIQTNLSISEPENWEESVGGRLFANGRNTEKIKALLRTAGMKAYEKVIEMVGQSVALSAARNIRGSIKDDYLALTYSGVPLLENSFTFSFMPKNSAESGVIRTIIFELRTRALPVYKGGYINYPDIFDVDLRVAGQPIMRYPYCVITNIETNYSPDEHIHLTKDKQIARIDLTISIKQVTQMDKNDLEKILFNRVANS